jgi:glycosyltransferase involved in cell wall biosynthesis
MPGRDEPTRILRVIARLNVGGPALHVSYLTRGLDARGYETMLVAGSVGTEEGSMEYAARELGIAPVFVPQLQREISAGLDVAAIVRLRRMIQEFRPHVVHTHTAKAGAVGRLAAATAHLRDRPVVVHTFHGHVLRGYFGSAQAEAFRRIEHVLARTTDRLIAVSPEVRDELVAFGVAPAEKFEVIRLGLDLADRAVAPEADVARVRRELAIPADRLLIGWFGRMTEIKRVDDLLAAFAAFGATGVDAQLALVGDGPERARLEALADTLGLHDRVSFMGMQRHVAPLYGACDIVALTSANEGTPVSLIEALAAGTPVVSTDVGGVRDVVAQGRSGLLVPPGDIDAFAGALRRLAEAPAEREAFGRVGRDHVFAAYSVDRLVGDVDDLYRRLIAERREATTHVGALAPTLRRPAVSKAVRPLRILLLSQYFPPEIGATQSRMQAFAEHLASRGHEVTVICEFPNHPHGVVPEAYQGQVYEDDRSNEYRVLRVWVKASPEKTQSTRMQFYLSYMALATAMAPIAGRADVVVATSPPLFTGLAGLALARLNLAPFVLDVRDLWPAAAVSLNQIPSRKAVAAGEALERLLYKQAAAVTAVTRPFCEHIDRIRDRSPGSVLIPNGTLELFFDADGEDDEATAALRRRLAGDRSFLVTFAGTLGIAQALPRLLDAAAIAPEVAFALVGDGPVRDPLVRAAHSRGLANVSFHEQVPVEDVPPILAASDALLVTLSAHPTFADFVPSKIVDFLAVGRPLVVAAGREAARLVERSGGGIAVPPESPDDLVRAVRWLAEHPADAAEMGRRGRSFATTRLRLRQAERLERLLVDLVGGSPADA